MRKCFEAFPLDASPHCDDNRSMDDKEIRQIVQNVVQNVTRSSQSAQADASMPTNQPSGKKIVALGADHGGFELKGILKGEVESLGFSVLDVGTNSKDAVDYPDFAHAVAQ